VAALSSWRLKLKRANCHLETLRADILKAGEGNPYTIPIRREGYPDGSAAIVVDQVPQDSDGWGLLLGDAVHDFRCALDHIWWELACRHLGREPTKQEAERIQFPILKPGGNWDSRNYSKTVGTPVLVPIGKLQPPEGLDADEIHPLAALRRLSNEDKHRRLHPTVVALGKATISVRISDDPQTPLPTEAPQITAHYFGSRPIEPSNKVISIPAESVPYFSHPDIHIKTNFTGYVALPSGWNVLVALDGIAEWVGRILDGVEQSLLDPASACHAGSFYPL